MGDATAEPTVSRSEYVFDATDSVCDVRLCVPVLVSVCVAVAVTVAVPVLETVIVTMVHVALADTVPEMEDCETV